jgi:molecular chaperone DnaK (HSP70)
MWSPLFDKWIELISDTLKDSDLVKSQIDEIILVSGSTRIPIIKEIIKEYFNGKELNKSINTEEVYSYGATIKSHIINIDKDKEDNLGY